MVSGNLEHRSLRVADINTKKVAGYILLPGIVPRLRDFGSGGFSFLAYLIVNLYVMVRILPENHPYNKHENVGKFGIRHVISEASRHVKYDLKHFDQVAIFAVTVVAFALIGLQIISLVFSFVPSIAAHAGLFNTPSPKDDIAFNLLDMVFGVPKLYCNFSGTCSAIQGELPWAFHSALHTMFQFYSMAILLLAVIILLYYIFVVVAETAFTGTPFGKRFNTIWAPMRLVVAVGMLVPVNYGLNSAQYLALYSAKYGSGLATNGWLNFNSVISAKMGSRPNPTGQDADNLAAFPNPPDIQAIVGFVALANACRYLYATIDNKTISPYLVKYPDKNQVVSSASSFQDAVDYYAGGDVTIRFGEHDAAAYADYKGNVAPYCGEITIHAADINNQVGAWDIQAAYYKDVLTLWNDSDFKNFGKRVAYIHDFVESTDPCSVSLTPDNTDCSKFPFAQWKQQQLDDQQAVFETSLQAAWQNLVDNGAFIIDTQILNRGWAGAGIWYNKIAQYNGAWMSAVHNVPTVSKYPKVMDDILEIKRKQDVSIQGVEAFRPNLSAEQAANFDGYDEKIARGLFETITYLLEDDMNQASGELANDSNVITKVMNVMFGTYGLFDIRNSKNRNVHPLAQLTGIGKGMLDAAIRNLVVATGFAAGGGAASALGAQNFGPALSSLSGAVLTITSIGIVVGFILYYVIPFLPFIYFFFAVGGWLKSVFEAMVGVPLWALAHLRIDGKGFPGDLATDGYFLILEIFIRPILCVFGLIAGISIFAAQARVLNEIFDLVVLNLTGFESENPVTVIAGTLTMKRNVVDEFFFTIIYTIILYMMGTASFKLIDRIPESILRWMGSGVRTFADNREDPTESLIRYAAIGGNQIASQVTGTITQTGRLAGSTLGTVVRKMGMTGGSGP